jgi:glutathione peroxidase
MKSSFNQFIQKTYDGRVIDPSYVRFRGMKSIVINVASECGYTDNNYKDIFEFATKMKDKVSIYLYPSNDFGGQEPKSEEEIAKFCDKYGVLDLYPTVKLMNKISVKDSELFQYLQYDNNLTQEGVDCEVTWNFQKFLINTDGSLWGYLYPEESLTNQKNIEEWCNNMEIIKDY